MLWCCGWKGAGGVWRTAAAPRAARDAESETRPRNRYRGSLRFALAGFARAAKVVSLGRSRCGARGSLCRRRGPPHRSTRSVHARPVDDDELGEEQRRLAVVIGAMVSIAPEKRRGRRRNESIVSAAKALGRVSASSPKRAFKEAASMARELPSGREFARRGGQLSRSGREARCPIVAAHARRKPDPRLAHQPVQPEERN
jgi:hypothetical protein